MFLYNKYKFGNRGPIRPNYQAWSVAPKHRPKGTQWLAYSGSSKGCGEKGEKRIIMFASGSKSRGARPNVDRLPLSNDQRSESTRCKKSKKKIFKNGEASCQAEKP